MQINKINITQSWEIKYYYAYTNQSYFSASDCGVCDVSLLPVTGATDSLDEHFITKKSLVFYKGTSNIFGYEQYAQLILFITKI